MCLWRAEVPEGRQRRWESEEGASNVPPRRRVLKATRQVVRRFGGFGEAAISLCGAVSPGSRAPRGCGSAKSAACGGGRLAKRCAATPKPAGGLLKRPVAAQSSSHRTSGSLSR
jgi:hypothetical protein